MGFGDVHCQLSVRCFGGLDKVHSVLLPKCILCVDFATLISTVCTFHYKNLYAICATKAGRSLLNACDRALAVMTSVTTLQ